MSFAQAQEEDRALLLRLQAHDQGGGGVLHLGVGDLGNPGHRGGEEVRLLGDADRGTGGPHRASPEVDVVGAKNDPGKFRVRVRVLHRQPAAREHPDAAVTCGAKALRRGDQRLTPGRLAQLPGTRVPDQRRGDPVGGRGVAEAPPALVAVPLLVDRRVVAGQTAQHLPATVVGPHRAAGRAVLAGRRRGDQVERAGPEPVLLTGERADRADLDGVAGEVRVERDVPLALADLSVAGALAAEEVVAVDVDLLAGGAVHQVDELVPGDLLGEPGAALAEHAALPVQQHLAGDVDRLLVLPLVLVEPGVGAAGAHRLVLQRALTALVTGRAVQRVVDQQQLHHAGLGLGRDRRAELGLHDHALGHRLGTRGDRLALALHLDQALPAGAGRGQQRVVAEPRDRSAHPLGDPDDQLALLGLDLDPVDGEGDQIRPLGYVGHQCAPTRDFSESRGAVRPSM